MKYDSATGVVMVGRKRATPRQIGTGALAFAGLALTSLAVGESYRWFAEPLANFCFGAAGFLVIAWVLAVIEDHFGAEHHAERIRESVPQPEHVLVALAQNAKANERMTVLLEKAQDRVASLEADVKSGHTEKEAALAEAKEWAALANEMQSRLKYLGREYTRQLSSAGFNLMSLNLTQAILFGPSAPYWQVIPADSGLAKFRPTELHPPAKRIEDALRVIETLHASHKGFVDRIAAITEKDRSEVFALPTLGLEAERPSEPSSEAPRPTESSS
jgi:hypothetical protein